MRWQTESTREMSSAEIVPMELFDTKLADSSGFLPLLDSYFIPC